MDTLFDGLEQIASYILNIEKRTYWAFLLSSGVIAYIVWRVQKIKHSFFHYIFNRKVWLSKSAGIDYGILILNAYIKLILLSSLAVYGLHFAYKVNYQFEVWFGQPVKLSAAQVYVFYTIALTLAKDFSFFIVHYTMHKIPILWEFHKIHHSATTLNPLTQYRIHPVELIINNVVSVFIFALITGFFDFLSDEHVNQYTLYGVGIVAFLFLSLGANLRHSHVKLKYPSFLEKIFISPYQHQIHHSNNPEHYDSNLGGKFAFWDLLFGTLIRSKDVERIEFGLGEEDKDYDTLSKNLFLSPVRNLFSRIRSKRK